MARTMAGGSHKRVMSRTHLPWPDPHSPSPPLLQRISPSRSKPRPRHRPRPSLYGSHPRASTLSPASPRPDHRSLGCPCRSCSEDRGAAVRPADIQGTFRPLISGSAAERHREEERRQTEELERRNRERREAEQKQYASPLAPTFKHSRTMSLSSSTSLDRWGALADERDVFYAAKLNDTTVAEHNAEIMRRNKEREAAAQKQEEEVRIVSEISAVCAM